MAPHMIRFAEASGLDAERWIRWMDGEVFPDDKPVTFHGSRWFIGWHGETPACYAAWRPHYPTVDLNPLHLPKPLGFLYRAGVMPLYRGKGLQAKLIGVREVDMRIAGVEVAATYTNPDSAASMRSLIACGYRPYEATKETNLAGEGRAPAFVHWRRDL